MASLTNSSVGAGFERVEPGSGVPQANGHEHYRGSGSNLEFGPSERRSMLAPLVMSPTTSTSSVTSQQYPPQQPSLSHHNVSNPSSASSSSLLHEQQHSQSSTMLHHTYQAQLLSPDAMQPTSRFLACLRCRGKKAKCDNIDTVCRACAKANAECVRPSGRRRKRTRREMEEAEREREGNEGSDPRDGRGEIKRLKDVGMITIPTVVKSDPQIPQQTPYPQNIFYAPAPGFSTNATPPFNSSSSFPASRYAPDAYPYAHSNSMPPYTSQNESYSRSTALSTNHELPIAHRFPTSISQLLNQPTFGSISRNTTTTTSSMGSNLQGGSDDGGSPPKHTDPGEVVQSLSKQVAFLEGDPGESQTLKVHYYRFSGCTAIHPGFNRIVIKLRSSVPIKRKAVVSSPAASTVSGSSHTSIANSASVSSPIASTHIPSPAVQISDGREAAFPPTEPNGGQGLIDHGTEVVMDADPHPDADLDSGGNKVDMNLDVLLDASLPALLALVDAFFVNFGQHFPFIRKERVAERLKGDTMSRFLLSAMCAVGVRFPPQGYTYPKPSAYISAAWKLALPLLRLPSVDVAAGLLLLSWAEFGENSESGLWNFSGMAMRMALDLGLHKIDDTDEAESFSGPGTHTPTATVTDDVCSGKLLFWAVFVMDRILSFGTGRSPTIQEAIVEVRLPVEEDMTVRMNVARGASPVRGVEDDGRQELRINGLLQQPMNTGTSLHPFVYIVRLFVLAGRIAGIMNGNSITARTLSSSSLSYLSDSSSESRIDNQHQTLQSLHDQLVDFLANLPPVLCWSVDNFRMQAARHRGGSFLFLHLWANAIIALIHHPNLGRNRDWGLASVVPGAPGGDGMASLVSTSTNSLVSHTRRSPISQSSSSQSDSKPTPNHNHDGSRGRASSFQSMIRPRPFLGPFKRSIKLSLASSRHIADCLVFADLFDASSYCANPFVNQCLFIAGVAFVFDAQMDAEEVGAESRNEFINALVKQNLSALLRALKRMEKFWSGLGYIISVLEQRAAGRGWAKVDFSITSDKKHRFISMPDTGLMRRLRKRPGFKIEDQDGNQPTGDERRSKIEETESEGFAASNDGEQKDIPEQSRTRVSNGYSSTSGRENMNGEAEGRQPMPSVVSEGALSLQTRAGSQASGLSSLAFGTVEDPVTMSNWSFESLLGSYQVEEVSTTDANVSGFDFESMFPEGFGW